MRPLALPFVVALVVTGCAGECPAARSITIAGESYCGSACAACGDCVAGFSCQFTGDRGVCVDEPFLVDRGVSTACEDPCPTGEVRYDDLGASACARICTVDGECEHCCFEPAGLEIQICAPRAGLCP